MEQGGSPGVHGISDISTEYLTDSKKIRLISRRLAAPSMKLRALCPDGPCPPHGPAPGGYITKKERLIWPSQLRATWLKYDANGYDEIALPYVY